ncbi:MAG: YcxB family protein [Sphingomonas sp.]|uniref:YcxB family protein n=1 Tax=Sphingomonas sp. TaxID=28214 RepID=UPI00356344FD
MTIEYASRRGEIWTWYWRAWRQRLWKSHLRIFLIVSVLADLILFGTASPHLAVPMAIGAIPVALLILYPQIRFKPQTRTITIGTSGVTTVVGRKSGRISWKNIRSVTEERGYVVVEGSSGNAFIIPPRAFDTPETQATFVATAKERVAAAR